MSETVAVPRHIGLILDGNRRWAKVHGLPTLEGHRKGYAVLKDITRAAIDQGVEYVSAYVFSRENWKRSADEVKYLMELAYMVATKEVSEVHKEGIRVRFLGSTEGLSDKLIKAIRKAEEKTAGNVRGTLALCFNYGGHEEIADAAQAVIASGEAITSESIAQHLYSPDIPPIDLLIRTSGEQRLSGFMLWRITYAELIFVRKHWPAFTREDLSQVLVEYAKRKRRFGV